MARKLVIVVFLTLAAGAAAQAISSWAHALGDPGLRAWLDVAYTTLKAGVGVAFAILVARRGQALRRRHGMRGVAVSGAAMLAVIVLQRPDSSTAAVLVVLGVAIALGGAVWMLASTLALGRCFGILPEARGLVTRGPYRVVRHPLYLGEFATCAGLIVASPTGRNLFAALVFVLAQGARMAMEERELAHHFPEYEAYARRTPRVIPFRWRQEELA